MTVELWMLAAATGVFTLVVLAQTVHLSIAYSPVETMGSRDELRLTRVATRFQRVVANHLEGLAIFFPLVLLVSMAGASIDLADRSVSWGTTPMSRLGSEIFVGSRIVHAVAYAAGVPVVRSVAWFAGLGGLAMIATAPF